MFGLLKSKLSSKPKDETPGDLDGELPLSPENNPPDGIEELADLIDKLQDKANNIKTYLRFLEMSSQQGKRADLASYRRSSTARNKTLVSIAKLQRLLKQRKLQNPNYAHSSFMSKFFDVCKDELPKDIFEDTFNKTVAKLETSKEAMAQFGINRD
jgi:hypothetical protein